MHTRKHTQTFLIHRLDSLQSVQSVLGDESEGALNLTCFVVSTVPQSAYLFYSVISYISQNDLTTP